MGRSIRHLQNLRNVGLGIKFIDTNRSITY